MGTFRFAHPALLIYSLAKTAFNSLIGLKFDIIPGLFRLQIFK